jgi:xanthine dehydrogenase YagS FAD-binding subunit
MLPQFAYVRPQNLEQALSHLSDEGARVHAGGTDLLGCLRDDIFETAKIVSISGLSELQGIRTAADGGLRIGALTTITEVAEHPLIRKRYTALAHGASEVASPQLRNQGTIGGNLCQKPRCWYYRGDFNCLRKGGPTCYAAEGENQFHCIFGSDDICYIVHPSDTAPALTALNAAIHIVGPQGRRVLSAENFHLGPSEDVTRETVLEHGEIVTEIRLPTPAAGLQSSYRKVRARRSWDFALAGMALAVWFEDKRIVDARVVLSGAAPVPWRSRTVENAIRGQKLDTAVISAAAKAVTADAQPLQKNMYKIALFSGVIEDELTKLTGTIGDE